MNFLAKYAGVLIAMLILSLWFTNLYVFTFHTDARFSSILTYLGILLQTHLYTGIFITAHDAMHGAVSENKKLNLWIGRISAVLFAYNHFGKLNRKHHLHHRFVASEQDPDYYNGTFFVWYYHFALQYVSFWQILAMAVSYNLLKLVLPYENLIVYWMLPSILSTFQLFYFGTYLPHKGEHDAANMHRSRSQPRNHVWAFLSCYFFGYHYEHHDAPSTPWWRLYRLKN
jgi:beta-carotene/zeaxanthin 4-ketolase